MNASIYKYGGEYELGRNVFLFLDEKFKKYYWYYLFMQQTKITPKGQTIIPKKCASSSTSNPARKSTGTLCAAWSLSTAPKK